MKLPFGQYEMRFQRIGYATRIDTITVAQGEPVDITVELAPEAVSLEPISVVVHSSALRRVGYYDRRELGLNGTFFTEYDIQRLAPRALTDLMYRAPAAMVVHAGVGRTVVRFNRQLGMRGGLPGCEPAVFLDGMLIQDQIWGEPRLLDWNRVSPSEIAAVEVYVGVNVPIEFKRDPCGTVLIWTKRGG